MEDVPRSVFVRLMWFLTLCSSALGGLVLVVAGFFGSGAPQQAAGAGLAVGLAVIPYVLTRACDEVRR